MCLIVDILKYWAANLLIKPRPSVFALVVLVLSCSSIFSHMCNRKPLKQGNWTWSHLFLEKIKISFLDLPLTPPFYLHDILDYTCIIWHQTTNQSRYWLQIYTGNYIPVYTCVLAVFCIITMEQCIFEWASFFLLHFIFSFQFW